MSWSFRATMLAGVAAGLLFAKPALAKDRFEIGEAVKSFTLKALNPDDSGESYVAIDNYYGPEAKSPKKAILLSFFATYCEPCKREMPYLAALHDTFKDQGLQVLLVTIDKDTQKIEEAKALARSAGVKFPVLTDRFNIVARRYFIEKLPCVYIIDDAGKVAMVNVGYSDDVSKVFLDEIRKLIGQPVSDPIPESLQKYVHAGPTTVASKSAPVEKVVPEEDPEGADAEEATAAPEDDKGKKDSKKKKRRPAPTKRRKK